MWIVDLLTWLFGSDTRYTNKGRVNYYEYIKSPTWKAKARACKLRAGMRCKRCGRRGNFYTLHAHHRTYARLGHERVSDLMCLCESCHEGIS